MRDRIGTKLVLVLLLVGVLLLGTTACAPEAKELMMAWFEDWLEENDTSLLKVGAAWALGGSSGNEEVDAALDAGRAIKDMKEADGYMEQGRTAWQQKAYKTAVEKIDSAITKRPNDWTYRLSRSDVALEQGDLKAGYYYMAEAQEAANKQDTEQGHEPYTGPAIRRYDDQRIEELTQVKDRLDGSGYESVEQRCRVYANLIDSYERQVKVTNSAEDNAKLGEIRNAWQQWNCGGVNLLPWLPKR